ncbi:MAG TPA: trypsin-like peptidase domain-containing protein [Rhodanobacteraceae bacterium]|nr:trypsin-like peptidase domain-containing protein [Rhodanobacteraceae bacterium]
MPRTVASTLVFIARFAVLGLAIAFVLSVLAPHLVERLRDRAEPAATTKTGSGTVGAGQGADLATLRSSGPVSYAEAVTRASPAVVNIYANKITTFRQVYSIPDPLTQRLLGAVAVGPPMKRHDQNLGSGVIFSPDGYVLTNNHVISGADDIQVLLDGGHVAQADVIGTDAETDLAVLKIDAKNLPTIAVADQTAVNVGDVVLAIGNPVGLGKTVTMGIVSGIDRQLNMSAYEDFIQTDAAINAGNSGGALVNALGELVGINTAIYPRTPTANGSGSYTPGAEGIGFAIPVATAKAVLEQIVKNGRVVRGWIGADYADIPLANGASARQPGVLVTRVVAESPAAQAGLLPGDLLLSLDGERIEGQLDLRNREAALAPGTKVHLDGLRRNVPFHVELALAQRPAPGTTGA